MPMGRGRILSFVAISLAGFTLGCSEPTPESNDTSNSQGASSGIEESAAVSKYVAESPEDAIKHFFKSLGDGDADAALEVLIAPEKMKDYCRIQAKLNLAFVDLGNAGQQAFGEEGQVFGQGIPAIVALGRLDAVQPVVNGDTATWATNPRAPMTLRRVNGGWRLDLYTSFQSEENVQMTNRVFEGIATYISDVANQMRGGEFDSVAEVQAELRRRRQLLDADLAG